MGASSPSTLWFQFPVLGRIRAWEAEALRKRVPTGPFGVNSFCMFLPSSAIRAPSAGNRQDLLLSPQPLVQVEWIPLRFGPSVHLGQTTCSCCPAPVLANGSLPVLGMKADPQPLTCHTVAPLGPSPGLLPTQNFSKKQAI